MIYIEIEWILTSFGFVILWKVCSDIQGMEGVKDTYPNPKWYNCCWLARAPKYVSSYGFTVRLFFNPILMSLLIENIFVILHFSDFKHKEEMRDVLVDLHHLILLPMVILIGLYTIFKQKRPGQKLVNGKYKMIGTLYGMPSGDSMYGAIICYLLYPKSPLFGVFAWLSVCCSRVLVGYHNIQQVTVGSLFGFLYIFIRNRINREMFVIFNWLLATFLPTLVFFDDNLIEVNKFEINNLQLWTVADYSYLTFDVLYCAPEKLCLLNGLTDGMKLFVSFCGSFFWLVLYQYLLRNGISISKILHKK